MTDRDEYMRRNLLHAKSVGANANLNVILFRLSANKKTPKWLLDGLRGVKERIEPLPADMAKWRDVIDPHRAGYELARAQAAEMGCYLVSYDVATRGKA